MKIFGKNNEVLDEILLCLTPAEARELADSASDLADHPKKRHHHVSSGDFQTEITVAVFTNNNINEFHQDIRETLRDELEAD